MQGVSPAEVRGVWIGLDNGGVVFAADDLGAWLTAVLADAAREKLTALVLGSDQERALRAAATATVQRTAAELRPGDDKQAAELAHQATSHRRQPRITTRYLTGALGTATDGPSTLRHSRHRSSTTPG